MVSHARNKRQTDDKFPRIFHRSMEVDKSGWTTFPSWSEFKSIFFIKFSGVIRGSYKRVPDATYLNPIFSPSHLYHSNCSKRQHILPQANSVLLSGANIVRLLKVDVHFSQIAHSFQNFFRRFCGPTIIEDFV